VRGETFQYKFLGTELRTVTEKKLIITCCRITQWMGT